MRKLLQFIMDRRPTKCYKVEGEDLFYRAFLFNLFGWTFYLHHYLRSDPDRGLHNHPFKAVALILSGGYWEQRLIGLSDEYDEELRVKWRRLNPGAINIIDQYCFHKLTLNDEAKTTSWSLFVCCYIPRNTWGFLRCSDELVGHKTEGIANFHYRKAGEAETDHIWFREAPKGKEVCKVR